jgi:hypothetical protein
MSKVARTIQVALMTGLVASNAAAASLPGFTLAAQTTHFSFYSRGAKVDAQKNERFLATVEKELGATFDGRAEYYRYERPEDIAAAIGAYAQGVTYAKERQIHSTQTFHAHEIVHLIAGQLGDPGAFFQEGLAVALGNEGRWNGSDVDPLAKKAMQATTWQNLVQRFETVDAQRSYPAAGSFVRSLIRTYGTQKVADFFRACPRPELASTAFQQTFGVTLDQAAADWAVRL